MDGFYRMPILQVRDARALSNASDMEALKNFFDSSPPPDSDPISSNGLTPSLGRSPDLKKQGRKRFFSLGKKRLTTGDLDPEPYSYGVNKSPSRSIPTGTTQRNLHGGHTVIMIGSPVPPPAMRRDMRTPTLEITPSSPILPSRSPTDCLQSRLISFAEPVVPSSSFAQNNPSVPTIQTHSVYSSLLGQPDLPKPRISRPPLLHSSPGSQYRVHTSQGLQRGAQAKPLSMSPTNQIPLETEYILDVSLKSPLMPHKISTQGVGMKDANPKRPTPHQEAEPSAPLGLSESQGEKGLEQEFTRARVESIEASPAEPVLQNSQQKAANRRAIYQAPPSPSSPRMVELFPPGLTVLPTPPLSSSSIPVLPAQTSINSLQSANSSKKRSKKSQLISVPHSTPMPNLEHVPMEIADLEAMENKHEAFLQLSGLYKQQKFLREAEEEFHQQKIADLTAGLMAQRMENLKLQQLLIQKGVPQFNIQHVVGINVDTTPLAGDASADTLVSEEPPSLDASRFAMLGKEEQFGRIRQFSSSHGSIATLEADARRRCCLLNDSNSALELIRRVKTSGSGTVLTPAPSMALPTAPPGCRNAHSMVISGSLPSCLPVARSRSLTESNISSVPYLDSFVIEQNMRRLERDCNRSMSRRDSDSTQSVNSSPEISDILFGFHELNGNEERASNRNTSAGSFSLIVQDVAGAVAPDTTIESASTAENMSNSGLCISSGLTLSVSTFHTAESSNDADVSTFSSTNGSPDFNQETGSSTEDNSTVLLRHTQPAGKFDAMRTHHTIFTNIPSIETSTASPTPRPASVDDVTWGALLMGLVRRAESRPRTSSDGDLERGESASIKSVEGKPSHDLEL